MVVVMRRPRGIQTKKISVSVTKEDLVRLSRRAKRLYGGNISALIHEMAEQAEKQEAIDKLWENLGKPTVSEDERSAIIGEWFS